MNRRPTAYETEGHPIRGREPTSRENERTGRKAQVRGHSRTFPECMQERAGRCVATHGQVVVGPELVVDYQRERGRVSVPRTRDLRSTAIEQRSCKLPRDVETQAGTGLDVTVLEALEPLEDALLVDLGDPRTFVAHADGDNGRPFVDLDANGAVGRVLQGVHDEVEQYLLDGDLVADTHGEAGLVEDLGEGLAWVQNPGGVRSVVHVEDCLDVVGEDDVYVEAACDSYWRVSKAIV